MATVKRYNLARFTFDGERIVTKTFKTTRKIGVDKLTSSDSHVPYSVMFKEEELDWDISDVDPTYRPFFDKIIDKQKEDPTNLPYIATYDYSEVGGELIEDDVFDEVWVEEISKDTGNKPFSVKGGAIKKIN